VRTWDRIRALLRREQLDRELDDEIRAHIELATEDYVRRGFPPAEARRQARLKFGAIEASKDAHRDSRGIAWLDALFYDLRFAIKSLKHDRSFTAAAVIVLALAIGLNVAVFAIVNTMLFRGFPLVKDNHRLLYIEERYTLSSCCLLYPDFLAWREEAKSFKEVAMVGGKQISLNYGSGPRDIGVALVTVNTFHLLGVNPLLGRDFVAMDASPGAPQVMIMTYNAWQERFAKRPDIIGQILTVDKAPATIVGVMPEGFDFPEHGLFWMPLVPTPEMLQRKPGGFMAVGRLADRASQTSAQAELDAIDQRLEAEFPASNKGVRARVFTYSQAGMGPEAGMIYGSLWAAALFVLLIACGNIANLALARTVGRSREFSTRIALGAGGGRLMRQIFTENLLLSALGGVLGWWLAQLAIRTWINATHSRYVVLDYTIGLGSVAYALAITLAAALLFSIIPILRTVRMDVNTALKGDGRGATFSRGAKHLSAILVAGQMTLAIVLLGGAGVLARSLWNIVGAQLGIQGAERILIGYVSVPSEEYPASVVRNVFWDRLHSRIMAIPGVESESLASNIPVSNVSPIPFELENGETDTTQKPRVEVFYTESDYFRTVGASTIEGRDFRENDRPGSPLVAIVNQSFAQQYWPAQEPLGKRVKLYRRAESAWYTVAGVASNIMQGRSLRDRFDPIVYVAFRQNPGAAAAVLVRTRVPAQQMAAAVRPAIEKAGVDVALEEFSTLQSTLGFDRDRMDLEHAELGKEAAVAPVFAILALILAAVGLYAVVARSVGQRTKEIGIRMAIGAAVSDIRRMVFREGMTPVALGLLLGLAVSLGVNRILQSQLVGVSPHDPLTLIAAPALLIATAFIGCQIPSRRAVQVDPAVALRHD
jgi:putative ABC transport system permease protein